MIRLLGLLAFSMAISAHTEYPQLSKNDLRESKEIFVTIDNDFLGSARESVFMGAIEVVSSNEDKLLLKVKEAALPLLSAFMHNEFKRCGGFFRFHDEQSALEKFQAPAHPFTSISLFNDYSIQETARVNRMMGQVDHNLIGGTIIKLSSYRNRYYKSKYGVESSEWIQDHWKSLAGNRTDVTVDKWEHKNWPQPSIIMTVKGKSDEIIVIGGHADSISGFFGSNNANAPGADDNASGIATITEIIRVLMDNNYQPEKTLKFMAYSAEEVGLLGSNEIASQFKKDGKKVIGVLQLDMTNLNASSEDIVLMTDFTNEDQNMFLGSLIDTYLPELTWGIDKCGYACSDHASWTSNGYPASIPFESKKRDMNGKIHTKKDTYKTLGQSAEHAAKFAKLGVAYVVEMDL